MAALILIMCACGSSNTGIGGNGASSLTSGNWLLIGTSNTQFVQNGVTIREYTYLRGALTDNSNGVSALLSVVNSSFQGACYQPEIPGEVFSGNTNANSLTLATTSTQNGTGPLSVTGTISSAGEFLGNYTASAGTAPNCTGDSGAMYGIAVPSVSGNWSGTVSNSSFDLSTDTFNSSTYQATAAITQGAPASDGTFPLSGTFTFQIPSSSTSQAPLCFTSAQIDSSQSYVKGEQSVIVTLPDANGAIVKFNVNQSPYSLLPVPKTATEIDFGYSISGGTCFIPFGNGKLTMSCSTSNNPNAPSC